jgi:hypothetical protein
LVAPAPGLVDAPAGVPCPLPEVVLVVPRTEPPVPVVPGPWMPTLVLVLAAPGLVVPVLLVVPPLVPPAPVDVRLPGWSDPEEPGLLIAVPGPCAPAPLLVWAVATPSPSSNTEGAIHNFCMIQAPFKRGNQLD